MPIDKELLDILVCPHDRGQLDYLQDRDVLVCQVCGYTYAVRDEIPDMLIEDAEKPGS